MVLHVTFSDGSNPWVSLPGDRQTIAKLWQKWMKNHPDTARPVAWCGDYFCIPELGGGFRVYPRIIYSGSTVTKCYRHLGHALAALERLGGANNE